MSAPSDSRWRRAAQDALVCALVLALVVLVVTTRDDPGSGRESSVIVHRLRKRNGAADTAGIVVGVLVFSLVVGFAWISCQHPQWNLCSCCGACCGQSEEDIALGLPRRTWFSRWRKGVGSPDVEMAEVAGVAHSRSGPTANEPPQRPGHIRSTSHPTRDIRVDGGRPNDDRIRSTTRLPARSGTSAPRAQKPRKSRRVEHWVKEQSQVHSGGHIHNESSSRPSADGAELQQPRPVQLGRGRALSVGQLQAQVASPDPMHGRQPSQASQPSNSPRPSMRELPSLSLQPTHSRPISQESSRSEQLPYDLPSPPPVVVSRSRSPQVRSTSTLPTPNTPPRDPHSLPTHDRQFSAPGAHPSLETY